MSCLRSKATRPRSKSSQSTSGILQIVLGPADGDVPVGAVIAYTLAEGEAPVSASAVRPVRKQMRRLSQDPCQVAIGASAVAGGETPSSFAVQPRGAPARLRSLDLDWRQVRAQGVTVASGNVTCSERQASSQRRLLARRQRQDPFSSRRLPGAWPRILVWMTPRLQADPRQEEDRAQDVEEALRSLVRTYRTSQHAPGSPTAPDAASAVAPRREASGRDPKADRRKDGVTAHGRMRL